MRNQYFWPVLILPDPILSFTTLLHRIGAISQELNARGAHHLHQKYQGQSSQNVGMMGVEFPKHA